MSLTISTDPMQPHLLHMEGDTRDFVKVFESMETVNSDRIDCVVVAGFTVTKVDDSAQHDGQLALRIDLADSLGSRSVGRLIVQHRTDFREEQLQWECLCGGDSEATLVRHHFETEASDFNKIADFEVDIALDCDTTNEMHEQLIKWAEEFKVSFVLVNPRGPGGGHPVVRVAGYVSRIRPWLVEFYDCSEIDIKEQNEIMGIS